MAESTSIDPHTSDSGPRSTSSDPPELPPIIQDDPDTGEIFPWSKFPGFVKATRPGSLNSWIWHYGYDITLLRLQIRRNGSINAVL
ncbi:hypothetical protein V1508DRAFT_61386 [Lipomyces doorenjongii]|uniref:uncharacterized protein n=1 Tax=Lipomyces doorenjongii TaxID=383834 RepID=UPI0034CD3116